MAQEYIAAPWLDPLCPLFRLARRAETVELKSSCGVAQAYAARRPLRLVVYSADSPYHSGRYFTASDIGDWDEAERPTLTVTWGETRK